MFNIRAIRAARLAALRAACRLKPAFQAVRATPALETHAEAGAILAGWGRDVRGAERRACRSGGRYRENRPAFQAGAAIVVVTERHYCGVDPGAPISGRPRLGR